MGRWPADLKREGQITRRNLFEADTLKVDEVVFTPGASPGVHGHDVAGARCGLDGEILARRRIKKTGDVYREGKGVTRYTKRVGGGRLVLLEALRA
jgi:hypothetical protein